MHKATEVTGGGVMQPWRSLRFKNNLFSLCWDPVTRRSSHTPLVTGSKCVYKIPFLSTFKKYFKYSVMNFVKQCPNLAVDGSSVPFMRETWPEGHYTQKSRYHVREPNQINSDQIVRRNDFRRQTEFSQIIPNPKKATIVAALPKHQH